MPVVTLTLTNDGHNFLRDLMIGADSANTIYFAVGSGTSSPTTSQHTLDSEQYRKVITSKTTGVSTGEGLINCVLLDSEAVGVDIEELGIFCGNTATSSSNTGKMFGRALWSHNPKTSSESIQLQLDYTV